MNILVVGQCTLHWGRMEFGNIGNFYIMEPFFRELHESFPSANVKTTFQMSERFCQDEDIEVIPMSLYYGWDNDLELAKKELEIANEYLKTAKLPETTDYIELVRKMDLVIDFSGDIWGDNADLLGEDRFYVGLIKDYVAQIFAQKTAMIAGSPGPFSEGKNLSFAQKVYNSFDIVTNREFLSKELLKSYGFDVSKTHSLTCPAFLFQPADINEIKHFHYVEQILSNDRPSIGFLICGWNFTEGPFNKESRSDDDYTIFAEAIEKFSKIVDADIYLMSHSNGFPIPPKEFKLIHGRDYPLIKQLQLLLERRGIAKNIYALDEIYDAWQTKAIIGSFDMVVSGRVHAAVAAMSQYIPTVIVDYGHEPKAHKLKGFADVAGQENFVAQPDKENDLYEKMITAWENRNYIKDSLISKIPEVKKLAKKNFSLLKQIV